MRGRNDWLRIVASTCALGIDAAAVVALRTQAIASGGNAGEREARRMILEKVVAAQALHSMALTGGLGWSVPTAFGKTVMHYRRKVRANRRRLAKKKDR